MAIVAVNTITATSTSTSSRRRRSSSSRIVSSIRVARSPVTGCTTRRTIGSASAAWVLAAAVLVGQDSSFTAAAAAATATVSPAEREKLATQDVERIQKSEFVQDLLQKSREKKEERDQERLKRYYQKNYSDYFQFQQGTSGKGFDVYKNDKGKVVIKRQSETENDKNIKAWLEANANLRTHGLNHLRQKYLPTFRLSCLGSSPTTSDSGFLARLTLRNGKSYESAKNSAGLELQLRCGRAPKEVSTWESDDCRRVSDLLVRVFDQNGLGVEVKATYHTDKKPLSPVMQEMRREELYNGIIKRHAYNDMMGGKAYCCVLAEILKLDPGAQDGEEEGDHAPLVESTELVGSVEVTLMKAGATGTPVRTSDLETLGISFSQWYAYVGSMAILPAYRKLGIGSLLLKQIEQLVVYEEKLSPGVDYVLLEVAYDNEKARALYQKHDYDEIRIDPLWQQQWLGIARLVLMAKNKNVIEKEMNVNTK